MTPLQITGDVSRRLRQRGIPHLVGGSMASSAWGEMRSTNDVDVAVLIGDDEAARLAAAFTDPYHASLARIEEALAQKGPYRYTHAIHMEEGFSVDLFLVRPDAYTMSEFERARSVEVVNGVLVPFSAPENIVLQKLRLFEHGNRVSDRQWNDVVRVLEFQGGTMDYAYLGRWARELGVAELLDDAFSQTTKDDPFA